MVSYRFRKYIHIIGLAALVVNSVIIYFAHDYIFKVLLTIASIIIFLGIVDSFSFYYKLDKEKIIKGSLFGKKEVLNWKQVECIAELSGKKNKGFVIGIYGDGIDMRVGQAIKNYKELIKMAVNESKKNNENVSIDIRVIDIINSKGFVD